MRLSVVIPVYNEDESLGLLRQALCAALEQQPYDWEVILVDDGSADRSVALLKQFVADDPVHFILVALRRNFGQTAAIAAGIDQARGDIIVLMDADMQNDPADIPMMLEKIDEGYDLVSGWRVNRQDTFVTRTLPSRIANGLISWVTGVKLHDYGCTLKAYRREVLTDFRLYGEMHRFIPALSKMEGARITEMVVSHHPRRFGKSKYNLTRTFKVILDLITLNLFMKYLSNPLRFFGKLGVVIGFGSIAVLALALWNFWFKTQNIENLNVLITLAFLFCAAGFQFIFLGLIAKLIVELGVRPHDYFFDVTSFDNTKGAE